MKISIITINYKNLDGLRTTADSIIQQTDKNFEWIVIDGGSNDGTKEYLESISAYISYWVSEPDKGIYNAMNKGVQNAKGDYCWFINSGDSLCDSEVIARLQNFKFDSDIVCCSCRYGTSEKYTICKPKSYISLRTLTSYNTMTKHIDSSAIAHPSTLIKRDLLLETPYDETCKIAADYKFWLDQLIDRNRTYSTLPIETSLFNLDGISSNQSADVRESTKVLLSKYPKRILDDYTEIHMERNSKSYRIFRVLYKLEKLLKS